MKAFILVAAIFCIFASNALAHGRHVSPIKPAYDCFHNPDGWDTRGDVVITRDDDLDVWVVWKCHCEFNDAGYFLCWWINRGQFANREKAVERAKELIGPQHGSWYIRKIRVSWLARPVGSPGCHNHIARRYAVVIRKAG